MTRREIAISRPDTGEEEWQALRDTVFSGWLTQGPKVAAFEEAFASRHGVSHALATTSCTTALHLMLVAAGIGAGDEVIVPSFSWIATANAVMYCGATPVFADVDPVTNNIDIRDAVARVTSRTRAVIVVHLFGLCADVAAMQDALPEGILVFEDCACAAGASLNGVSAGAMGLAGAFSFHPRKSITTGEGGMLTTNDDAVAVLAGQMRNHGASLSEEQRHDGPSPYLLPDFHLLGFNYRMTDLQGSVGLVQLSKLDRYIQEREAWADYYCAELADVPWLHLPVRPANGQHAWQSFVTRIDESVAPVSRNDLMSTLQELGIATRPGTHAIHLLDYYRERFHLAPDDLPGSKACAETTMAIPLHNRMTEADYAYIVSSLRQLAP